MLQIRCLHSKLNISFWQKSRWWWKTSNFVRTTLAKGKILFFIFLEFLQEPQTMNSLNGLKRLACPPVLCLFAAELQKIVNSVSLQGHYRYCEALFSMGEVEMAIYNNSLAMHYCQGNKDSLRDLEQQHLRFRSILTGIAGIILIPHKLHV